MENLEKAIRNDTIHNKTIIPTKIYQIKIGVWVIYHDTGETYLIDIHPSPYNKFNFYIEYIHNNLNTKIDIWYFTNDNYEYLIGINQNQSGTESC